MKTMLPEDQTNSQELTDDEFSFGNTEVEVHPSQDEVSLSPSNGDNEQPIISSEEELTEETPKVASKPVENKPVEEKPDLIKTMRENNLEIFTKEFYTNDASDEEFATKIMSDKYFGESTLTKPIDFKEFDFTPDDVLKDMTDLETELARSIANLSPDDKKKLGESKGSDELIYNEYLMIANDNIGKVIGASVAVGAVVAAPVVGVVATAGAFAAGTLAAFSAIYGTAEVANSIDRAQRTSPEDVEALNNTTQDKQGILHTVDDLLPNQYTKAMTEMLLREDDDTPVERYAKEFGSLAFDAAALPALFKGIGASTKGFSKVAKGFVPRGKITSAISDASPELSDTIEKLNDLVRVKKIVKETNKRLAKAKESFDSIIKKYEASTPPPIPSQANNSVDYDKLAGEAYERLRKSGFKDDEAREAFEYLSVKGSKHNLGTKRTVDLTKEASQESLAKVPEAEKFGKGAEGTGTETMDLANKIDELGEQRLFAQNSGDFVLDAKLDSLQETLMRRVDVMATKQGGNLQEINRSMPLRRSLNKQYTERAQIGLELKRSGITAKHRAKLTRDLEKAEKRIKAITTNMQGATSGELVAMGVANTIYSNMLGGAAVTKAALGGLVSTTTNNAQLLLRGVSPTQIYKMNVNAARQMADDIRKIDFRALKSDVVNGTINSRFKVKNAADLTIKESDSAVKKGLKKANKAINVIASPIQGGLGTVDNMLDTFNSRTRVTEAWLDYSARQQKLGRSSDELVDELRKFTDNPEDITTTFNREVLQAAEEGLATDKMMLTKAHSKGNFISKPAWGIDKIFNDTSENLFVNTTLKFVNPFTRTAASMLDSIAENSALGMFRTSAPNGAIAAITPRQMIGTAASIGLFYGFRGDIESVPQASERTAGAMGLRSGIQVGGHQFPMEVLGVYGEVIDKFMVMNHAIEAANIDGVDTSAVAPIFGGLLEVSTAYGMAENVKSIAQSIMNVPEGKNKLEVSRMIENFMPAGYLLKGGADLSSGALASNPFLAQVFGAYDTEFGNAKRRDAFGTPLSEGEMLQLDRNFTWLIDRKGEDKAGLAVKKDLLNAGVFASPKYAAFRTEGGLIPYSSIKINGDFGTFSATMTPLLGSITIGGRGKNSKGSRVKVSSATKNKALGIMSLEPQTIKNIIDDELTNLSYMDTSTKEARFLRDEARNNLKQLQFGMNKLRADLSQYGMKDTLPKTLKFLMENDAPNISSKFKQKRHEVMNLMKHNRTMFGGDLNKQREFFSRVNRVKDTALFYNSVKTLGTRFMQNSAEAVSAEIERIQHSKTKK